ncbi:uncharacterized protein LOC131008061 [Salvia miltiorrhiza]|uniref:uncharacterized protein LOC131008061 n=1 Tax=Salvia miltiorrhiza TaxID=226208 RepID=UPI0025AC35CD|nr:uncharacterized protein LOC131008061 [Salvia miltiorrhiza]
MRHSPMPVRRCSFMTSNVAEAFNIRLLWARRLPICSMLEAIRLVIEKWFSERLRAAQQNEEVLTDEADKKVAIEVQKSRRYIAQRLSGRKYKVQTADRSFKVDLEKKKCECRAFQLDQLPCYFYSEIGDTIAEYVDSYYTKEFLIDTYSGEVNNLPPRHQWWVLEYIAERVVLPLIVKGHRGAQKKVDIEVVVKAAAHKQMSLLVTGVVNQRSAASAMKKDRARERALAGRLSLESSGLYLCVVTVNDID